MKIFEAQTRCLGQGRKAEENDFSEIATKTYDRTPKFQRMSAFPRQSTSKTSGGCRFQLNEKSPFLLLFATNREPSRSPPPSTRRCTCTRRLRRRRSHCPSSQRGTRASSSRGRGSRAGRRTPRRCSCRSRSTRSGTCAPRTSAPSIRGSSRRTALHPCTAGTRRASSSRQGRCSWRGSRRRGRPSPSYTRISPPSTGRAPGPSTC